MITYFKTLIYIPQYLAAPNFSLWAAKLSVATSLATLAIPIPHNRHRNLGEQCSIRAVEARYSTWACHRGDCKGDFHPSHGTG